MGIPVAKFDIVEEKDAPKQTNKVMSAEDVAARNAYAGMLKSLKPGQVAKLDLSGVGGEHPARSLGIVLGHIIKDIGMVDQFDTWNNEGFYCIARKAAKVVAGQNGTKEAVAV